MMTPEMIHYRISQIQRDIDATWQKYRRLQLELADLLKAQAAVTESTSTGQLLTEQPMYPRYRDQE